MTQVKDVYIRHNIGRINLWNWHARGHGDHVCHGVHNHTVVAAADPAAAAALTSAAVR
jgi:hypothetical protein